MQGAVPWGIVGGRVRGVCSVHLKMKVELRVYRERNVSICKLRLSPLKSV